VSAVLAGLNDPPPEPISDSSPVETAADAPTETLFGLSRANGSNGHAVAQAFGYEAVTTPSAADELVEATMASETEISDTTTDTTDTTDVPADAPDTTDATDTTGTTDAAADAPAAPGEELQGIDAVRARLAARGLLQTGPAILVPKEPRPDRPVWIEPAIDDGDERTHPLDVAEDEWDVKPEGSGYAIQPCPQCRGTRSWPVDVTRFRCHICERAWRWAVCQSCEGLSFTIERQESWRCRCGQLNRAWWRTDAAQRDKLAQGVVVRRRDAAAAAERARVRAGMRKRRWKLIAGAVVGVLLVAVFVIAVRAAEPTQAGGTSATCAHFGRLRANLASGTVGASELSTQLDQLKVESASATPAVQKAVVDLVAAGHPSRTAFLAAQTSLADACAAARR
jgi:hypothetical protein